MEVSCKCRTRGRGKAGCPCSATLIVRLGYFCRSHFGHQSGGLWRTKADISGNSDSSCRSSHYAVACERETTAIRSYRRRSVEGGPCSVGAVCLPLTHLPGGTGNQCDLARKVAEPIAALVVLLLVVREGREAIRGKGCGCCQIRRSE